MKTDLGLVQTLKYNMYMQANTTVKPAPYITASRSESLVYHL